MHPVRGLAAVQSVRVQAQFQSAGVRRNLQTRLGLLGELR